MKQTFKIKLLSFSLVCGLLFPFGEAGRGFSQNVGINATGASADASALLDLSSTNAGFLITRVDTNSITSPAFGLMTLAPTDSCLYMYSGSNWISLGGVGTTCGAVAAIIPGSVTALNCAGATVTGTLTDGTAASGVSVAVAYTGGNGGTYSGQTVTSTGVTGLTATLAAGSFATGAGSLTYNITGTPATSGTASFAITVGGQTCTFTIAVAAPTPVFTGCIATAATVVVDVTNPTTGKIWMDRNLGASQVATSSTDAAAYGCLYQWGRAADGHEDRGSAVTATNATTNTPGHASFITEPSSPYDWRTPQNNGLWQGVAGINNPCPTGYRIPTEVELNTERLSWATSNSAGAFASPLRLSMGGYRFSSNGSFYNAGSDGFYWSSTVIGTSAFYLTFNSTNANVTFSFRAFGFSVRCIKD